MKMASTPKSQSPHSSSEIEGSTSYSKDTMYSPATSSEEPNPLDRHPTRLPFSFNWCPSDAEFKALAGEVQKAIKGGIFPERIAAGSSGSYFAKDRDGRIVGVFKPKSEEPYGDMNPRWSKWFQRVCCPCAFGRSCLTNNQGYVSEAAASIVDRHFRLNVVPRTEVVELAAPCFHYGYWIRRQVEKKMEQSGTGGTFPLDDPRGTTFFPRKIGSFQLFVRGFRDAGEVLAEWQSKGNVPPELDAAMQHEFERMVILDYAIRNTDRGMDNWLVHVSWVPEEIARHELDGKGRSPETTSRPQDFAEARYEANIRGSGATVELAPPTTEGRRPIVKIAAIDNGLAFPFKHPDRFRSYPYGWSELPWAQRPFSDRTALEFLPLLSDPSSWDDLIERLRSTFRIDENYSEHLFRRQMSVLRGQLFNLREALRKRESPQQLLQRPWLKIEDLADTAPATRYLGDTYTSDPGRIWNVQGAKRINTTAAIFDDNGVPAPIKSIPPQQQRWKTFVRERPYLSSV